MKVLTRRLRFLQNLFLSDEVVVRRQYRKVLGRSLDLEEPRGFHEKICWIRLNRLTPLHTYCADKITAAAYVHSRLGPGYTVPRYFTTSKVAALSAEAVSARSCVIKPNHASQTVAIVEDTGTADWPAIRARMCESLTRNFYWAMRESQYRDIRPSLIVEERLDMTGVDPGEVNMYCLNGRAEFFLVFEPGAIVAGNRGTLVDRDFRPLPVSRQRHPTARRAPPRPAELDAMIDAAETLAKPFPLVRVDFLRSTRGFFVNELTFSPLAGYERFIPEAFELEMGAKIDHTASVADWNTLLAAARACEAQALPPAV